MSCELGNLGHGHQSQNEKRRRCLIAASRLIANTSRSFRRAKSVQAEGDSGHRAQPADFQSAAALDGIARPPRRYPSSPRLSRSGRSATAPIVPVKRAALLKWSLDCPQCGQFAECESSSAAQFVCLVPFGRFRRIMDGTWFSPYEKSGSAGRFADFAIYIRRIVQANEILEYMFNLRKNKEGEEIISIIHRMHLSPSDPHYQSERLSGRRKVFGSLSKT